MAADSPNDKRHVLVAFMRPTPICMATCRALDSGQLRRVAGGASSQDHVSLPPVDRAIWKKLLGPVDLKPPQARGAKAGGAPSAAARLAEQLEKHPDLRPYTLPATAGDIAELGKKLDEIAGLLRQAVGNTSEVAEIKSLMARFAANGRA